MPRVDAAHKGPDRIMANRQTHKRGEVSVLDGADVGPSDSLSHYIPCVVFRGPVTVNQYEDYFVMGPIGSRQDFITVTFKPTLRITTGCFSGSLEDFETEVSTHPVPKARREYMALIAFVRVLAECRAESL